MPTPEESSPPSGMSSSGKWLLSLVAVAAGAMLFASYVMPPPNPRQEEVEALSLIGTSLPSMQAEGWFNGDAVSDQDLEGKVVLIDAWAFWCGPCRRVAPALRELYEKYEPQGVKFIGLTTMDGRFLPQSREFIESEKIPWVQGYGAIEPLYALRADAIPQIWIAGKDGRILWDVRSKEPIEKALDRALKGETAPPAKTAAAKAFQGGPVFVSR